MSNIERSIEVNVPVNTAYNQWTMFEEFPRFMQGVEEVRQLDDKRLHWRAEIGQKDKEWDAEIVDQVPDQRVAWRSITGTPNGGIVTFRPIDANRTEVTLNLEYEPQGFLESIGDALGFVSRRVEGDLDRFKQYIESRGAETGGWRGEIHGGQSTGAAYGSTTTSNQGANYASSQGSSTVGYSAGGTEQGEVAIPVVEEELRIGKREVESGGVQVSTRVEEQPVQEQVTLREERVEVERRPANRPASDADLVSQGTLEVRERSEQPVVQKEARVVEEVVVGKEVQERTETIQDTVRRTDVDVEETPGTTRTTGYSETDVSGDITRERGSGSGR